jgi:hypothetical protein
MRFIRNFNGKSGVLLMVLILILLFMVPFIAISLALKKAGWGTPSKYSPGTSQDSGSSPDLSVLRSALEKQAERSLPIPQLRGATNSAF